jgi:thiol-disulfide isomerase/thioredoxin
MGILALSWFFTAAAAPSLEIEWKSDLESAYEAGQERQKNVLVLVTAPSWCAPCRELRENALRAPRVVQWVNRNYVPVRLLDSNPTHARLSFPGYPTLFVMSPRGKELARHVGPMAPQAMAEWIGKHSVYREPSAASFVSLKNGFLRRLEGEMWQLRRNGAAVPLEQYDADERFRYLRVPGNEDTSSYYAVTRDGTAAFAWDVDRERWKQLPADSSDAARPGSRSTGQAGPG